MQCFPCRGLDCSTDCPGRYVEVAKRNAIDHFCYTRVAGALRFDSGRPRAGIGVRFQPGSVVVLAEVSSLASGDQRQGERGGDSDGFELV